MNRTKQQASMQGLKKVQISQPDTVELVKEMMVYC